MKHLELIRFAHLPEGVLGKLNFPSGLQLYTVERPWRNNRPFVSCIPAGTYELEWDITGRIRDVPRLRGTEPRTQINIHSANWPSQLQGCIAPGMDWRIEGGTPVVSNSKDAMDLLSEQIKPSDHLEDKRDMVWADTKDLVVIHIKDILTINPMEPK